MNWRAEAVKGRMQGNRAGWPFSECHSSIIGCDSMTTGPVREYERIQNEGWRKTKMDCECWQIGQVWQRSEEISVTMRVLENKRVEAARCKCRQINRCEYEIRGVWGGFIFFFCCVSKCPCEVYTVGACNISYILICRPGMCRIL